MRTPRDRRSETHLQIFLFIFVLLLFVAQAFAYTLDGNFSFGNISEVMVLNINSSLNVTINATTNATNGTIPGEINITKTDGNNFGISEAYNLTSSINSTVSNSTHGVNTSFELNITNIGEVNAATYNLTLNNLNGAESASLNQSNVTLNINGSAIVIATVGGYGPGQYNFSVYVVAALNTSHNDTINFTLNVTGDQYEHDDVYTRASTITIDGVPQTHTIDPAGDYDWVNFSATKGYTYKIETLNLSSSSDSDTYLYLYGTDGSSQITNNDDIDQGVNRNARIIWRADASGVYFVMARHYSASSSGGVYNLSVLQLGNLKTSLITPVSAQNATKYGIFNVITGVTCVGGPCTAVIATLDPKPRVNVDKKVRELLKAGDDVPVIVKLIDDSGGLSVSGRGARRISEGSGAEFIKNRKEMVKLQRDRFKDSIGQGDKKRKGRFSTETSRFRVKKEYQVVNIVAGDVDESSLADLERNPLVESIEYDRPIEIFLDTSRPNINADDVESLQVDGVNITGEGQTVCIVDSGIDYGHVDFGGLSGFPNAKVIGGYDYSNSDSDPSDDEGACAAHGTHVAGIVASEDATYRGIAPGAKIVAVKSLKDTGSACSGSTSTIVSGIDYCVLNKDVYNISVITMSIGDSSYYMTDYCDDDQTSFTSSINAAVAAGIVVTVASGNEYRGGSSYQGISTPACIKNATSVGAVNDADVMASFTNRGAMLDILMPGVSITATDASGTHVIKSGTSMATPHAAGLAALIQQYVKAKYNRNATPKEVEDRMKYFSVPVTDSGTGLIFPRPDALRAVQAKGVIPTTVGARPFYTTDTNPVSCGSLTDGQSCNTTWSVNATGLNGETYEFFTIYDTKYVTNITPKFNVTILLYPEFSTLTAPNATEDLLYTFDANATNDEGLGEGNFTYSLLSSPQGMVLNTSNGNISWTANNSQVGLHNFSISATDNLGLSVIHNFTIYVNNTNDAPVFNSTPRISATEDAVYTYDVNATDIDPTSGILIFAIVAGPSGMSVNSSDGNIFWTPNNSQVGLHTVNISVNDSNGGLAYQNFSITVSNAAPVFTSTPRTSATEDIAYSYDANSSDEAYSNYFLITSPSGMTMDASTGVISWTANNSQVGANMVNISVNDTNGGIAYQNFTITVANVNDGPVFNYTVGNISVSEDTQDTSINLSEHFYDVDAGDSLEYN
ncbi:MAG: S8 family serine peptidase, partial [Candidatus Nanoarchaeia archaeon]